MQQQPSRNVLRYLFGYTIETFADHLDQCANHMGWNDTLATYMLAIPEDSIDLVDMNDLLYCVNNVTAFYTLNHDKSV